MNEAKITKNGQRKKNPSEILLPPSSRMWTLFIYSYSKGLNEVSYTGMNNRAKREKEDDGLRGNLFCLVKSYL